MGLYSLFDTHAPYCIKELADNSLILLNREYKPLGITTKFHVGYENYPRFAYRRSFEHLAEKLGAEVVTRAGGWRFIFLYDCSRPPVSTREKESAQARMYAKRLKTLCAMKFYSKRTCPRGTLYRVDIGEWKGPGSSAEEYSERLSESPTSANAFHKSVFQKLSEH